MRTAMLGHRTGSVAQFDEHRGVGTIDGDDGCSYPFHCTAVADGTRTIDEGVPVRFEIVAGRLGRWEAWRVEPR
jgi:cold shock CspA family protein